MTVKRMFARGLLVVLCLALWPALASAAAPPNPTGKLVYQDDFNDSGKKSGLEENKTAGYYEGKLAYVAVLKDGQGQVVKKLRQEAVPHSRLSTGGRTSWNSCRHHGSLRERS